MPDPDPTDSPPPPLDYRRAGDRQPVDPGGLPPARRSWTFRIGVAGWGVPPLAGVGVGVAYGLTGGDALMWAGAAVAAVGVLLSLVGGGIAVYLVVTRWRAADARRAALSPVLLLGSNYVVAVVLLLLTRPPLAWFFR